MARVYVSGPMTGLPELNFPAFNAAAAELRRLGYEVVNPAEINPDAAMPWEQCMRADIKALCDCDVIALLPGWENSKGAHLEVHIAHRLGIKVRALHSILLDTFDPKEPEHEQQHRGAEVRFDTEEAFFTAAYRKSSAGPAQIAEAFDLPEETRKALITAMVGMMRAAFDVHQRALAQIGPGDSLLGHRIDQAAESLPPDWQIVVQAKRGEISVDLYGPDDDRHEFPLYDETVSGLVKCALDEAIARGTA